MINHLEEIHRELYLPQATHSVEPSFTAKLIDEPSLYTDANLWVCKVFDTMVNMKNK